MSQQIQISAATGTPPYDVYICDITLTTCYLISGGTTIPPTVEYTLTGLFENTTPIIVKLVDSQGCEFFKVINCPTSPTPTPTNTPTPTPTTTPGCHCISFVNTGVTSSNYSLTQCDGTELSSTIGLGYTLYYCGSNPSGDTNVVISIGGVCSGGACVTPTPSP